MAYTANYVSSDVENILADLIGRILVELSANTTILVFLVIFIAIGLIVRYIMNMLAES